MSTLAVILIVLAILVIALAVGGFLAAGARRRQLDGDLRTRLEDVNHALALARAEDRGWERSTLEAAARDAAGPIESLELVQVLDRPGTDEDKAVFRIVAAGEERELVMGRREGAWVAE